ncbi:hypothetical protein M9Y10_005530 [Tritrichomonas musculus]|uniref:PUM-HD domain-containing protein n=1 Tax=Tritrichomonas musculus TaxID=1915356 RepID=A0ABR2JEM8_9EUKA
MSSFDSSSEQSLTFNRHNSLSYQKLYSSSSGSFNYKNHFHTNNPESEANCHVHLIPSDLWEAITGEHLSPQNICQLCDIAIPSNNYNNINNSTNSISPQINQNSVSSDLNHQYVQMARDRQGSRQLQQKIQDCSDAERSLIFAAIIPSLSELVYDQSSNYVIQKLCEYLNNPITNKNTTNRNKNVYTSSDSDQENANGNQIDLSDSSTNKIYNDYREYDQSFLAFFLSDIQRVVEHPNSCRVLQKYIEHTNSVENVDQIYVAVRDQLNPMCTSPNGNHIVQRFIEMLPKRVPEVVSIIKPYVSTLVIDSCGCRVVQKLFDKYNISLLRPLVDEVLTCAADLATNQYGNYVVQNILESGPDSDIEALIHEFKGGFYNFSIHKFASNVIEKCIRRANPEQREEIFEEIIGDDGKFEEQRILKMVTDQFGNYVMQRIIEFGSESQQNAIYEVVYDHYAEAMKKNYARHVITRLQALGYEF